MGARNLNKTDLQRCRARPSLAEPPRGRGRTETLWSDSGSQSLAVRWPLAGLLGWSNAQSNIAAGLQFALQRGGALRRAASSRVGRLASSSRMGQNSAARHTHRPRGRGNSFCFCGWTGTHAQTQGQVFSENYAKRSLHVSGSQQVSRVSIRVYALQRTLIFSVL